MIIFFFCDIVLPVKDSNSLSKISSKLEREIIMTGAMAGSTAMVHREPSSKLQVITLTINNKCNLQCPHCYLKYEGSRVAFNETIIGSILESSAHHIAIVGKEPLIDAGSVTVTERLVSLCVNNGKTVSLVTNGFGLHKLSAASLSALEWVDVSLDGGPTTYSRYRRGDFAQVLQNVRQSLSNGARSINVLNTISSLNLSNIDDMMSISALANWGKIILSPYTQDQIHRTKAISSVSLSRILEALQKSDAFLGHSSTFMLIGSHSFKDQGLDTDAVACEIEKAGLVNKVIFIKQNPLFLGYLRVTYDGYLLTPYQSLYPSNYHTVGIPLEKCSSLDSAFLYLRAA